jgi:FkbM family methyltransferase
MSVVGPDVSAKTGAILLMSDPLARFPHSLVNSLRGRGRDLAYALLFKDKTCVQVRRGPLAGCTIHARFDERVAYGIGTYEPEVAAAFQPHATDGAVVYDVGAHIGFFTMIASKSGARVIAFEANPANVDLLRVNVQENGFRDVTINAMAVSDHSGTLTFATYGYSLVGSIAEVHSAADAILIEVPCVSLDDFVRDGSSPAPTVVKLDVEGAEGLVIRGALQVLRNHRPVLIVEMHSEEQRRIVFEATSPIGYQWRRLNGSKIELPAGTVGQFLGRVSEG